MLILAMESSAKPASVAVVSDGVLLGLYYQESGLTHSRTLVNMTQSLLSNLSISLSDIGLVAVSRGPGSFTGVRIGVSAAKGLAWGLGIPVCGVSTLEAMASQTPVEKVILCPVMDARRAQVYNSLFQWREGTLCRLCDDRAISLGELAAELRCSKFPGADFIAASSSAETHYDNPLTSATASDFRVLLIGDGAEMSFDFLISEGINCQLAPVLIRRQTAYGVALAAVHESPVTAIELEPCYLRPSQAERERMR